MANFTDELAGDGAQNGRQVPDEKGVSQGETFPLRTTSVEDYERFSITNVPPTLPDDIFDDIAQDWTEPDLLNQLGTAQQQQSFNEQLPMSTQPSIVVQDQNLVLRAFARCSWATHRT